MITLLSAMLMTAQADSPVTAAPATLETAAPATRENCVLVEIRPKLLDLDVPTRTITFDADRLNRLGLGDDLSDVWALVPGRRSLGGHTGWDTAVMLDGVPLLDQKRLGPMP